MDASPIKLLTRDMVDTVAQQARNSDRLRKNYNFHALPDRVQRFINVLQPGTYVRPHRHCRPPDSDGFEFFLVLQGNIGLLLFDETGQVIRTEQISADGPVYGIEVAQGSFHTLVALAPDSVMFELKEGPYIPLSDKDFLPNFPLGGTPQSHQLVAAWQDLFGSATTSLPNKGAIA